MLMIPLLELVIDLATLTAMVVNHGIWQRSWWTPPIFWTQPIFKQLGGNIISNLEIYPNPSRDIFYVSFSSEKVQDLKIRILNIIGEIVYDEDLYQFTGEYIKSIDLGKYEKAMYFLEIQTNDGTINKKLILQ